jgi:hypothetical protein
MILPAAVLTGCMSLPEEPLNQAIEAEELSAHVHFLAQPALRGRKPMSRGSRWARRYLTERFNACGLVPWGEADAYAQSFGIGTNMVGVLPGSDPNLAGEIVIVSAHYDHLGKTDKGLCLGASDNAAGVAALLEIAEHLVLQADRPRRTVCFAAFDQEESALLGALAFSQRSDFHGERIAGIVNIDLLGRAAFDVLPDHLFVTGTAGYPGLRRELGRAEPQLTLLPVSEKLLGARSDHAAFSHLETCTLFFSCGPYSDYHQPGDRAENVDYEQARASTRTILTAVQMLANSPRRLEPERHAPFDAEEWQNLKTCLHQIAARHETLGGVGAQLLEGLEDLPSPEQVTPDDLRDLFIDNFDALTSLMFWPEDPCDPNLSDKEALNQFALGWRLGLMNLDYSGELLETGQALAGHFNRYRKRLFWGIPDFEYEWTTLHDGYLHLDGNPAHPMVLTAIPLFSSLTVRPLGILKWPPRLKTSLSIGASWEPKAARGSREDLMDICLLDWGRAISEGDPNAYWGKVMARVSNHANLQAADAREDWLDWRLASGGWSDADAWTETGMTSANPYLAYSALRTLPEKPKARFEPVLAQLIADANAHSRIRRLAIGKVHRRSQQSTLRALARIVDDATDLQDLQLELDEDHPHRGLLDFIKANRTRERELWSKTQKPSRRKQKTPPRPKTLGEAAHRRLQKIAHRHIDANPEAWLKWIEGR